jgi:hypothetical protein
MIEPQTGFALIALTRTGRGGDVAGQLVTTTSSKVSGQQSARLAASPNLVS